MIDRAPRASILCLNALIKSEALYRKKMHRDVRAEIRIILLKTTIARADLRSGVDGWSFLDLSFGGRFFAKDCDGKLCVVEAAALVFVVGVEEGTQLLLREVHARLLEDSLKLGEIYSTCVHDVKVLEHLHQASLFRHLGIRFLNEFVLESFLKPTQFHKVSLVRSRSNGALTEL